MAQTSAAAIAVTSTPALPDSVCRNARSGAERLRAHNVRPRQIDDAGVASDIAAHENRAYDPRSGRTGQPRNEGRLTSMASCVLRAITTTASVSGSLFSSRCGVYGGTKT